MRPKMFVVGLLFAASLFPVSASAAEVVTARRISERKGLGRVEKASANADWGSRAQSFARAHVVSRGANGAEVFEVVRVGKNAIGNVTVRLAQKIAGLPVVGADLFVYIEPKSGDVTGIGGAFVSQHDAYPRRARISAGAALEFAIAELGVADYQISGAPQLTYILEENDIVHLAWTALVGYSDQEGEQLDLVYADAESGALIGRDRQIERALSRQIYDCNFTSTTPGTLLSAPYTASQQKAYDHAGIAYNYFSSAHGRDSFNDLGTVVKVGINYVSNGVTNNAAWLNGPQEMVFGPGDASSDPFWESLDIVAHEFTHGVNKSAANFGISGESAALSESMSDCFAAATEAYSDGSVNSDVWTIGDEIGTPQRYLNDPASKSGHKDYYPTRAVPAGEGDQYKNAGISNLAFYLLVQGGTHPRGKTFINVSGIGMTKARTIWYEAFTHWAKNKTFRGAWEQTVDSAKALYGVNSTERTAVQNAWLAVGNGWDEYVASIDTALDSRYSNSYVTSTTGVHTGQLSNKTGSANFDLYLEKLISSTWTVVATAAGSSSTETIEYSGTSGTYRWRVTAASGTGEFDLWMNNPR